MDITAPTINSDTDNNPQPLPATEPRIPAVATITRIGERFGFELDGKPFPFVLDDEPIEVVVDPRAGYSKIRITLVAGSIEVYDEPQPEVPPLAPVDVPPGVATLVGGIAKTHTAITYHEQDPNRLAIEYAAAQAGLATMPSATIQPRTVKGAGAPRG